MAELVAHPGTVGQGLPLAVGRCTLAAPAEASLTSLAPFRGQEVAVARAIGAGLPDPGRSAPLGEGRILWAGIGQWLVQGAPLPDLGGIAAVSDQSDAWVGLRLSGADAGAVLARLVPVDVDPVAFLPGCVARTMLRHVMCVLIAAEEGFDILVMRSFAGSAMHEIAVAMRGVAGRAALDGPH